MTTGISRHRSLADLLDIENDDELVGPACSRTGVGIWALLRLMLFREVAAAEFGIRREAIASSPVRRAVALAGGRVRSRRQRGPHDVLIWGTGQGWTAPAGGTNRIWSDIAAAVGGATVVLDRPAPRNALVPDSSVTDVLGLRIAEAIERRRAGDIPSRDAAAISAVVGRALERTRRAGVELDPSWAEQYRMRATEIVATFPQRVTVTERFLSRARPRIVLAEEGSYPHRASLSVAARRLGIPTYEIQHGMISSGHDAYNVHPRLARQDGFRCALPDGLLTYGTWWGTQHTLPIESVPIGNLYRDRALAERSTSPQTGLVAICGQGSADSYRRLVDVLRRVGYQVVYRPHPLERAGEAGRELAALEEAGVRIDGESPLYDLFGRAEILISEASTVLFEAAGAGPEIWVHRTELSCAWLPEHPFAEVRAEDGALRVHRPRSQPEVVASLWKPTSPALVRSVLQTRYS